MHLNSLQLRLSSWRRSAIWLASLSIRNLVSMIVGWYSHAGLAEWDSIATPLSLCGHTGDFKRCNGLAPWSFTITATKQSNPEIKMPRARPVESHVWSYIAANVSLHGPRPWHPGSVISCLHSSKRENSTGRARGISSDCLWKTADVGSL